MKQSLELLAKGRTTLIIAHRLSTFRNANRTIVLKGNRIVEQGTHDVSLTQDEIYAKLYPKQFELKL